MCGIRSWSTFFLTHSVQIFRVSTVFIFNINLKSIQTQISLRISQFCYVHLCQLTVLTLNTSEQRIFLSDYANAPPDRCLCLYLQSIWNVLTTLTQKVHLGWFTILNCSHKNTIFLSPWTLISATLVLYFKVKMKQIRLVIQGFLNSLGHQCFYSQVTILKDRENT